MLVGGYRLLDRGLPKKDPDRPKIFSPMLLTVLDRLWPLGGSCTGVALNFAGNC
jgi:hypothetical protein